MKELFKREQYVSEMNKRIGILKFAKSRLEKVVENDNLPDKDRDIARYLLEKKLPTIWAGVNEEIDYIFDNLEGKTVYARDYEVVAISPNAVGSTSGPNDDGGNSVYDMPEAYWKNETQYLMKTVGAIRQILYFLRSYEDEMRDTTKFAVTRWQKEAKKIKTWLENMCDPNGYYELRFSYKNKM
jgi:Icc-related predicted phosphoesterase